MRQGAAKRNECWRFWRGDQYVYVHRDNYLVKQGTVSNADGSAKRPHRVRQVRNLILDIVAHEVSAATQRVPSYGVSPSSTSPDRISAAKLSEKVLLFGYDHWRVRQATVGIVTHSVVADEGFAWPIFDNTIGPFISDAEGNVVGQGDVRIRLFGGNECYWEPSVQFDLSPWHAVEQALVLDDIYQTPGYLGGVLNPDASSADTLNENVRTPYARLALVTDYLERPSIKNPKGLWITTANGRMIFAPRPYPCVDGEGKPVDEPVLHRLTYFDDPSQDRGMGLVRHLVDPQRTFNDTTNKTIEWKNLSLNKQLFVLPGVLKTPLDDTPGGVFEVMDLNGIKERDPGQVPPDLLSMKQEAREDMYRIAAQNDIPEQLQSGKSQAVFNERDQNRRYSFIAALADFHSRLARHMLYLVQRHYTEDRLIKIRGQFGPETRSFRGADLKSECDVRVSPESIEPITKDGVMTTIQQLATLFPGSLNVDKVMSALNGQSLDELDQGYELQVEKQQREIHQMIALSDTLHPLATGADFQPANVCIPIPADDDEIHLDVLHQFMETEQFEDLPDEVKTVVSLHEQAHQQQQAQKAAQAAEAQAAAAEQQGAANAAKPQTPPPAPNTPFPR